MAMKQTAQTKLTHYVLWVQFSGFHLMNYRECLMLHIYRYPQRRRLLSEEDCAEFLLFMMEKMERIINRFTYCGASFETYIGNVLTWQVKTFISEKQQYMARELLYYRTLEGAPDTSVYVEERFDQSDCTEPPVCTGNIWGKNPESVILIHTLLHAGSCSDTLLQKIAKATSLPYERLLDMVRKVISCNDSSAERQRSNIEKCNIIYVRKLEIQILLAREIPGSGKYCRMLQKLRAVDEKLVRQRRRAQAALPGTPYEIIAGILGIPVGTVASKLHYSRKRLAASLAETRAGD